MFRRQLLAAIAGLALIVAVPATMSAQSGSGADSALADTAPLNARVVVAHLAPFDADNTEVTVVFNGAPLGSLSYKETVPAIGGLPYLSVPPGDYPVQIYAGTTITGSPVLSQSVTLAPDTDYTVAAVGDKVGSGPGNIPLQLLQLTDNNAPPASTDYRLRVVHAAPFAPQAQTAVDILPETGNTPILANVPFGAASPYLGLPAGTPLDVRVVAAGTQTLIFNPPAVSLSAGQIVTAFAIGGANGYPAELFALPGGTRAMAMVRAAHFAPFAEGDASVNVLYNDVATPLISDLTYGEVTGYLPVPQGDYTLKIDVPAADPALAAVVYEEEITLQAGSTYTVVAVGDNSQAAPLDLLVLTDNPAPPAAGKARIRVVHASPVAAAATVDVRTQAGDLVPTLGGLPYKGVRELTVDPGVYDLKVTNVGGATTLIDPPPFVVGVGDVITLYANGDGADQDLGVAASLDQIGLRLFLPYIPNGAAPAN